MLLERDYRVMTPQGPEKRKWYFPSRSDCVACHTRSAGFALGWNTRQLNRPYAVKNEGENQITAFQRLGIFGKAPSAEPSELDQYPYWKEETGTTDARAYLDANCAMCHVPGGSGNAQGSRAHLNYYLILKETVGGEETGGVTTPRWITPRKPFHSFALLRISTRDPKEQMPPLASNRVDEKALTILKRWIEEMFSKDPGR